MQVKPVHRTILAVDIEGFGRRERDDDIRARLRDVLHVILDQALTEAGITPEQRTSYDTGDGALVLIDALHKGDVLDAVGWPLLRGLRRHNELASEKAHLRLRAVVHAGEVVLDRHGATGDDLNFAFRLLNSRVLHDRLAMVRTPMTLIVSEFIYHRVVEQGHSSSFDAASFERVTVVAKETRARAWCYPPPALPSTAVWARFDLRAGVQAWLRAWRTGGGRSRRHDYRLLHRLAIVLFVLLQGLWIVPALRPEQRVAAVEPCPLPVELIIQTTPMMEATLRDLAQKFTAPTEENPCRRGRLTVFAVQSASQAAKAVAADWSDEDLALGPEPAVWVPADSVDLERVKNLPGGNQLESLGPVATSPVVLAMPLSAATRLGQPPRSVPWRTMLAWGQQSPGRQSIRLVRPDPTSSTAGLLATAGLYAAALGTTELRSTPVGDSHTPGQLHDVEQALETSGDELTELCRLTPTGGVDRRRPAGAILTAEQTMVAYNRGKFAGLCNVGSSGPDDRLAAFYATDGAPVLDHPYVLLPAATRTPERERLARAFYQYLQTTTQEMLLAAGFRDVRGRSTASEGRDGVLRGEPRSSVARLDGATLKTLINAWEQARKPVRVLLAMDVSGSMNTPFAGEGGRRITAAKNAAEAAVRLMGGRDEIALWRFSHNLGGRRDYDELVPMGPAVTRAAQVRAQLRKLEHTSRDTGLYDTMYAGITRLRAGGPRYTVINAMVVLTDGENDDRVSDSSIDAIQSLLRNGEPVLVFMITFGIAHCDRGNLVGLTEQLGIDFHCVDASRLGLRQAFEKVTAELWGTKAVAG
jgi:hypothetical protein